MTASLWGEALFQECKRQRQQWPRPAWSHAALFALCVLALPARATDQSTSTDCIQPAQGWLLAQAAQADKPRARTPGNRQPISERELRSLIRAFESVPDPKSSAVRIRAALEKSDLRAERADLLVRDVTLVLASIQATETLAALKRTAGMDPGARAWMERALGALPGCARARFSDRGGEPAYAATAELIRKNRTPVEQMQAQMFGMSTRTLPGDKR